MFDMFFKLLYNITLIKAGLSANHHHTRHGGGTNE